LLKVSEFSSFEVYTRLHRGYIAIEGYIANVGWERNNSGQEGSVNEVFPVVAGVSKIHWGFIAVRKNVPVAGASNPRIGGNAAATAD
jgi:hypothetical protein